MINQDKINIYQALALLGDCYGLSITHNPSKLLELIDSEYSDKLVRYNPRKNNERYGLSITSLDGKMSGIPDLDSIMEFNKINGTSYREMSFRTETEIYQYVSPWLTKFRPWLARSHIIKLCPGGYFPPHRDSKIPYLETFRLFIPIINCSRPHFNFIIEDRHLSFEHGRVYFINTLKDHVVFNANSSSSAYFIVANIELTEESMKMVTLNTSSF